MILTLNNNVLPMFKRMSVKNDDAVSTGRVIGSGDLRVDRTYKKDRYVFEYDFFDIEFYNIVAALYEQQFTQGRFFQMQLSGTEYPINTQVFILPTSIKPRFAGKTIEGYTLELMQR